MTYSIIRVVRICMNRSCLIDERVEGAANERRRAQRRRARSCCADGTVAVRKEGGATNRSARAMPPLRSFCAPALAALLLPFAADASGTCQRLVPGTQMDGNGCGPADSAVGDACNTADDCFFGQTPGRCVCTPAGPPPAGPPPPPVACVPPPPPPPTIAQHTTDEFVNNPH
jgi:hypothetical protein